MATTATQQSNMTTMDVVNQTIIRSLEDLPLMSDYELEQVQRALQEQEQLFQIEITLMERHLMSTIGSIPADKDQKKALQINADGTVVQQQPLVERLNMTQKVDIASKEIELLKEQTNKMKQTIEKDQDNYKAEIEECDMRVNDVKKASYDFKREIEQQSRHQRTGKIMAERVARDFEENLRYKDSQIEKTRLKNTSLKTQMTKLQVQLKQKEESGEVLNSIDFDQLNIENSQYQAKIEEKNAELFKLKTIAGGVIQTLNQNKDELLQFSENASKSRSELKQRLELRRKLAFEVNTVTREVEKLQATNDQLKFQMEEFKVPDIMEYVVEKVKHRESVTACTTWQRKNEVKELEVKRLKQRIKQTVEEAEMKRPLVADKLRIMTAAKTAHEQLKNSSVTNNGVLLDREAAKAGIVVSSRSVTATNKPATGAAALSKPAANTNH